MNIVDISMLIFTTVGCEFGIYFPYEYGCVASPAVIGYFTTRKKAVQALDRYMKNRYPKLEYIIKLNDKSK